MALTLITSLSPSYSSFASLGLRSIVSFLAPFYGTHKYARTHHKSLDIFYPCTRYAFPHQHNPNTRPSKHQHTKSNWYQPVQWRKVLGTPKYGVERWCVYDKHPKACATQNACEIVFILEDLFTERIREFGFDSEDLVVCMSASEGTSRH